MRCSLLLRFSLVSGPWQEQVALAAARSEYLSKQREMAKQQAAQNRSSAQQFSRHGQSSPAPTAAEQRQQRSPQHPLQHPQDPQQRSLPEYQQQQQQQQQQQRPSTVAVPSNQPRVLHAQQQKTSTVAEENVVSPSIVAAAAAAGLIGVSLFSISLAFRERQCVQSSNAISKGPCSWASIVAQACTMRSRARSLN